METTNRRQMDMSFPQGELDVLEQELLEFDSVLLERLLQDKTTKKNIKWGTEYYQNNGERFEVDQEISVELVTGTYSKLIHPRISKTDIEQDMRTKENAEVFTPSWVCNKQNNQIDEEWFGRPNVFNIESGNEWIPCKEKITFPNVKGKTWQDYVENTRIEITCGEAPYLVSRYDTVTGAILQVFSRIGILDRKLRVICENTDTEDEWLKWAEIAFQHTYGYDYQGDNVLLARENLLCTYVDYYITQFGKEPTKKELRRIAHIISWNIWQMDGIKMTCPFTYIKKPEQITMDKFVDFGDIQLNIDNLETDEMPCRIMDWKANKSIEFKSLIKELE